MFFTIPIMDKRKTYLIDIGNSQLSYCEYKDTALLPTRTLETDQLTTDLIAKHFDMSQCVIASVVPKVEVLFRNTPSIQAKFLTHKDLKKIPINIPNPEEVGIDRLINALAAKQITGAPCMIIDSGTALTCCYVDESGVYQGGAIFPGMRICSKALHDYTAKIPLIWVEKNKNLWGKSTEEAVKVGLYNGFESLIKNVIKQYRQEIPGIKIVGTGAGLSLFQEAVDLDYYDAQLIFRGLSQYV